MEAAFRLYFMTGPVHEDWTAWSRLFTDDALYHDHFWGTFRGPSEIERFLEGTMSAASHVYSPLRWYSVGDERVVYEVLNRADHPIEGRAPIEFPSLQDAHDCYHSPEYTAARKFRDQAGKGEFVLVEGVE